MTVSKELEATYIISSLTLFIVLLFFTSGCLQNILYKQLNEETLSKASLAIQNFTGDPSTAPNYQGTDHQNYADINEFSSEQGKFYVNSVTSRVQTAQFISPISPSDREIDLDTAYLIAENYAKQKYPELWETSDSKGVHTTVKELPNHGDYSGYDFAWSDEYYSTDANSNYTFIGPNSVHVTLTTTGAVLEYDERYFTLDPHLNLIPTLTEDQAWAIAVPYYASHGAKGIVQPPDGGLLYVITDDNNRQHLAWVFNAVMHDPIARGGTLSIDAHTGEIIRCMPYG